MRRTETTAWTGRWKHLPWLVAAAQFAVAPATALQILQATDHAELNAEVSTSEVNRIALEGDRIARVVQSGGAFTLEHDPVRGDLYLYPGAPGGAAASGGAAFPEAPALSRAPAPVRAQALVTLYLGTEKGLTYRLTLTPVERDSAQILIRNAEAMGSERVAGEGPGSGRESAIVELIGAVARREPLPGYVVDRAPIVGERDGNDEESELIDNDWPNGARPIETWRGPRFTARVFAVPEDGVGDASALAAAAGPGAVGAWLAAPPGGPADGNPECGGPSAIRDSAVDRSRPARLAVVVEATRIAEAGR